MLIKRQDVKKGENEASLIEDWKSTRRDVLRRERSGLGTGTGSVCVSACVSACTKCTCDTKQY